MIKTRVLIPVLVAVVTLFGACGGDGAGSAGLAGLATVYDSAGDTVRARVEGTVDSAAIRQLVAEARVAGEVNDSIVFGNAGNLTLGASGDLVMYDYSSTQLLLFSRDGQLRGRLGQRGSGPGEYAQVSGLVGLPDSSWVVYDVQNSRVSFFRADGSFRDSWLVPASTHFAQGMLGADARGNLWLAQYMTPAAGDVSSTVARARILDGGRTLADTMLMPTLGVKAPTYRAMGEMGGGRSSVMTGNPFSPAEFALWHHDGHWVLLEGGTYRILFARREGKPLVVERVAPPIPVDPDERAFHEERITRMLRTTDPAWTWQGTPIPSTRAPARSMFVARDGNVWVTVALPSVPIPEAERDPVRPNAAPPARWRTRSAYEVFDRHGRFLGRIALPGRTTLYDADGDTVWGTQLDENDVPTLVRFTVTPSLR